MLKMKRENVQSHTAVNHFESFLAVSQESLQGYWEALRQGEIGGGTPVGTHTSKGRYLGARMVQSGPPMYGGRAAASMLYMG